MAVHTMNELLNHRDHKVEVVCYVDGKNKPANASIECIDCGAVLVSIDDGEFLGVEELLDYKETP